jgi:CDP-diacylglycerol---glycerol-3-phosphate 3-phosphatidyltransferase
LSLQDRALNLPNALTVLRIFLVPLLVVVLWTRFEGHVYFGAAIFGLAVLTDYLDGFFARRRNEVTRLGILLDPLADKLLTAAAFLSLVEMGLVPAWVVMIILARELAVTGLRNLAAGRGVLIRASGLGKAKMVAQVTAILLILLSRPQPALRGPGLVALAVVVAVTLWSGADYFLRFWKDVVRGTGGGSGGAPKEPPQVF